MLVSMPGIVQEVNALDYVIALVVSSLGLVYISIGILLAGVGLYIFINDTRRGSSSMDVRLFGLGFSVLMGVAVSALGGALYVLGRSMM